MSRLTAIVVVAVLTLVGAAGCTRSGEPQPTPTPRAIAPTPSPGAQLVCGIDKGDIELLTGSSVDRWDDQIVVTDGAGTGKCEAFSDQTPGEQIVVELFPVDSAKAKEVRQRIDGKGPGNPPGVVYDPQVADGAAWGVGGGPSEYGLVGPIAYIFWGRTLVNVYLTGLAPGRSGEQEMLALTQQVADSYGLSKSTTQ